MSGVCAKCLSGLCVDRSVTETKLEAGGVGEGSLKTTWRAVVGIELARESRLTSEPK